MKVFVDTSAMLAVVDAEDLHHLRAAKAWSSLVQSGDDLVTTNYVLLESAALIQRRLGLDVLRQYESMAPPMFTIEWVDEALHRAAMVQVLISARKNLSLVDCVSFETMRKWGIDTAFAFDRHFAEQGFEIYR